MKSEQDVAQMSEENDGVEDIINNELEEQNDATGNEDIHDSKHDGNEGVGVDDMEDVMGNQTGRDCSKNSKENPGVGYYL